uniref:ATP synthase subunit a n=1 Tax=Pagothenia borchgrevinki TaxID=8213 RepID=A0A173ACM1_PAGBO|nr:ATP synthase F0 subunit 6 [Pagothenia borchgrevinki]ANG07976.1 ATPase subunit 6 [Pagothenia borchgrevinki]AOX22904.1 ATP synthase F0 subunit 6 [Pagothenia borchgrevinki]QSJ49008.1 ATP synthase F0 subunit 6 [Pagothenia borchgrevinki]UUJ37882.1 ATP synthase F0 subunit 6 [Pagothenia borchgrevinki]
MNLALVLGLFDQFFTPYFLGVPLLAIAIVTPWVLFPGASNRVVNGRTQGVQNSFVMNFAKQILLPLNVGAHKWALLLTALMINLISLNLLGLLPYTFTPTTQVPLNMGFAIPLWLATVLIGLRNQPTIALGHLLPEGTPAPLIPVLIIIETISLFVRPFALGVRLTANLAAGHLLIQLLSSATLFLLDKMWPVAILTGLVMAVLTLLELAVAVIQAYVFVLLLSLYLQENT